MGDGAVVHRHEGPMTGRPITLCAFRHRVHRPCREIEAELMERIRAAVLLPVRIEREGRLR